MFLHEDTSYKCGPPSWCFGLLCKEYLKQPKWCGKVKVDLIAFIQICCYVDILGSHIHFFGPHLQVEDYDLTYAGCSFEAILNQTMHRLGYDWKYADEWPTLNTEGFQAKLLVTKRGSDPPTSRPPLIVISRPCARTCQWYFKVPHRWPTVHRFHNNMT
jgi:hypothetical protein